MTELFLRLEAERERRRKNAIYVGAAFSGDESLLSPDGSSNGTRSHRSREEEYEALKSRLKWPDERKN